MIPDGGARFFKGFLNWPFGSKTSLQNRQSTGCQPSPEWMRGGPRSSTMHCSDPSLRDQMRPGGSTKSEEENSPWSRMERPRGRVAHAVLAHEGGERGRSDQRRVAGDDDDVAILEVVVGEGGEGD